MGEHRNEKIILYETFFIYISMGVHRKKHGTVHDILKCIQQYRRSLMPSGFRIRYLWFEIPVRYQLSYVDSKEYFSILIPIKTL